MRMKKIFPLLIVSLMLVGAGCTGSMPTNSNTNEDAAVHPAGGLAVRPNKDDLIVVNSLSDNAMVESPLTVTGEARGSWYFEAVFPVDLYDADGILLAHGQGQADGDWMTTDYVPFSVTLTFSSPRTDTGVLKLSKDNPSGDPARDNILSIPVRFTAEGGVINY